MSNDRLRVAVAQISSVLGNVQANLDLHAHYVKEAEKEGVDLLLFPELALSGYPVSDWFSNASIRPDSSVVGRLKQLSHRMNIVTGFIEETEDVQFYNSAMYLSGGKIRHVHRKIYLPTYRIFDEARYFGHGWNVWAFNTPWCRMAILICGDCWHLPLPYMAVHDGADVLLILAASAREGLTETISSPRAWERMNHSYALTLTSFVVFANHAGVQQGLNFWGGSHVVLPDGNFLAQAKFDEPDLLVADLDLQMLRHQRLVLPFRRDDRLELTLSIGKQVLARKSKRRDGFGSVLSPLEPVEPIDEPSLADEPPPGDGSRNVAESLRESDVRLGETD